MSKDKGRRLFGNLKTLERQFEVRLLKQKNKPIEANL